MFSTLVRVTPVVLIGAVFVPEIEILRVSVRSAPLRTSPEFKVVPFAARPFVPIVDTKESLPTPPVNKLPVSALSVSVKDFAAFSMIKASAIALSAIALSAIALSAIALSAIALSAAALAAAAIVAAAFRSPPLKSADWDSTKAASTFVLNEAAEAPYTGSAVRLE